MAGDHHQQARSRTTRMQRCVRRFRKLEDLDYVTSRFESAVEEATRALVRLRGECARRFGVECLHLLARKMDEYRERREDVVEGFADLFELLPTTSDGEPQICYDDVSCVTTMLRMISRDQQFWIFCNTRSLNRYLIRWRERAAFEVLPYLCNDVDGDSESEC